MRRLAPLSWPTDTAEHRRSAGNKTEALKWIDEAYRSGWRLHRESDRDPLLADLRNEPAFRDLVKRMERDVAEMRRRIDVNDNPRLPPPNQPSGR